MVAVEDWKNQLYEKTQIAVKYSPAKYKPAYKIMRTRGIENYEIDDMDVTFISEVIHKCSYIFPSKVETRKAIEQLTEDRNVNGHSDENEECEELYRYAFLSLTNYSVLLIPLMNGKPISRTRLDCNRQHISAEIIEMQKSIDEET